MTRGHDAANGKPEEPGALKVFDYSDGKLTNEVSVAPNGGYGFGPRHLDFHPTKPFVYVALERQNRLDLFKFGESGALSSEADYRINTLDEPHNIRGRQVVGTVHVHPNGRTVYVANRASSTVEATERASLPAARTRSRCSASIPIPACRTPIQHVDTRGIHCRTFHIDPSGRLLVAAHIMGLPVRDNGGTRFVPACLSLFRIGVSGRLEFVRKYDVDVGDRTMWWMGMVAL